MFDDGGWEKAFGCGVKTGSLFVNPIAVEFPSSSSSSEDASSEFDVYRCLGSAPT